MRTTSYASLKLPLLVCAVSAALANPAANADVTVCPSGCAYNTIQAAIDAVGAGEVVTVKAGTYREAITINKSITVKGVDGASRTVIDASNLNRSAVIISTTATLQALTVRGGSASDGGGVLVTGGQATIKGNIIRNNRASDSGGGIWVNGYASATIVGNRLNGNGAGANGGGVAYASYSSVVIDNNQFNNNSAINGGGVFATSYATATITRNRLRKNRATYGGGAYLSPYSFRFNNGDTTQRAKFERNRVEQNLATEQGGGIFSAGYSFARIINNLVYMNSAAQGGGIYAGSYSNAAVVNSTVANNQAASVGGVETPSYASLAIINSVLWNNQNAQVSTPVYGRPVVTYSDVEGGYPGDGNIDADPLFVDTGKGDYQLRSGSPAIDTGRDTSAEYGINRDFANKRRPQDGDGLGRGATGDGSDYDMGAYEANPPAPPIACELKANGDGTVTDTRSGLMWVQDAKAVGNRGWNDAQTLAASVTTGGFADWRLPEVGELETLYANLTRSGTYDPAPFVNMEIDGVSDWRWSNTLVDSACGAGWNCQAWYFDFQQGIRNQAALTSWLWLLPVRSAGTPLCNQ